MKKVPAGLTIVCFSLCSFLISDPAQAQTHTIKLLVVGGGGQGGGQEGGGGGAGEHHYDAAYPVTQQPYAVTIGAGGTGYSNGKAGADGGSSSFGSVTAIGGGGGGGASYGNAYLNGRTGGSGGGASGGADAQAATGGTGTAGYNGGSTPGGPPNYGAGGGGGSGGAGADGTSSNAGNGGPGTVNSITGSAVTRAAGGGGARYVNGSNGSGGGGGAGNAGNPPTDALSNTGSGGGGFSNDGASPTAGKGGSGIVIVSYVTADFGACTGGTITTNGENTVHTFTEDGTFTVLFVPTPTPTLTQTPAITPTPEPTDTPGPPGTPGPSRFTLSDIYNYINSGTTATIGGHALEPPSASIPGDSRFKTLNQIYYDIKAKFDRCDATSDVVMPGYTFFCTRPGDWGVRSGTYVTPTPAFTPTPTWYEQYGPTGSDKVVLLGDFYVATDKDGPGGNYNTLMHPIEGIAWAEGLVWLGKSDWVAGTQLQQRTACLNNGSLNSYWTGDYYYITTDAWPGTPTTRWSSVYANDCHNDSITESDPPGPVRVVRPAD